MQHIFAFTGTIAGPGPDRDTAKRNLAACLDDALQHLDDTCVSADITTSPVTLIDAPGLAETLLLIRNEADAIARGATLTRLAPAARIRAWADQILDAIAGKTNGGEPACNVCGDPGQSIDDGTGQPYVLCDEDDQAHACVREGIARIHAWNADNPAALHADGNDGAQD